MEYLLEYLIFGAGTAVILAVTWSLPHGWRTHGFYRVFAFEAILLLFVLNLRYWFRDPFAAHQLASWFVLTLSLPLVLSGFYLLRAAGHPRGGFENTTALVRVGVYRYIRHPLYASLLCLAWGVYLKHPSPPGTALALVATAALLATAKVEEGEMVRRFGDDYRTYMRSTALFIPFLF